MSWNETANDQFTQLRDRFETDLPDRDCPTRFVVGGQDLLRFRIGNSEANRRLANQQFGTFTASPPNEVSLYFSLMSLPVCRIVSMHESRGLQHMPSPSQDSRPSPQGKCVKRVDNPCLGSPRPVNSVSRDCSRAFHADRALKRCRINRRRKLMDEDHAPIIGSRRIEPATVPTDPRQSAHAEKPIDLAVLRGPEF